MPYNLSAKAKSAYQVRSLFTLLRMGHCAPTVMQTLLAVTGNEQEWPVRLTAGLPGGVGNSGGECGGLTSPLIFLGLRHGLEETADNLPVIFEKGHAYCRRFHAENDGVHCRDLQNARRCAPAICHASGLLAETLAANNEPFISGEQRAAYTQLYAYLRQQDFHCAHAVLRQIQRLGPRRQDVRRAASAFLGGALFQGMTCSAFTAGVMVIGLESGEIENSYRRVIRMMIQGMDISDEEMNKFHRTINRGYRLATDFIAEYGSIECRTITGCNFAAAAGVEKYIADDNVAACRQIANWVAEQVQEIISEGD